MKFSIFTLATVLASASAFGVPVRFVIANGCLCIAKATSRYFSRPFYISTTESEHSAPEFVFFEHGLG